MDVSKAKVLVFDLDGTVYEDTHHFDYQAERLKDKLPLEKQSLFQIDFDAVKRDEHPIKIGRVYDGVNDLVLVQLDNIVQEAYEWNGLRLSDEEVGKLYPDPIEINFETMLSIGDPWWTSTSIAGHYGLNSKECYEAFLETREYMMGPEFEMEPIVGFKEVLSDMYEHVKLVLLTNSPQPDSEAILAKIGLDQLFDLKIFNGEKPTRTLERFERIKSEFGVEYDEIVSVGDNWINEIRPVRPLGCGTIFIDPHGVGNPSSADFIFECMGNAIPVLKKIGNPLD
ncbi:HAD family hydrolase [Robertmurraya massiliosenegalensis]|uniref:HAD family hydrolase n=1 Tax=Robertmurraya TaxID=2837507 RepID=UPI0039A6CBC7